MSYVIIKQVKIENKQLPVLLIDEQNEVLSFEVLDDAEYYCKLFQINSDSNHTYTIKRVGNEKSLREKA